MTLLTFSKHRADKTDWPHGSKSLQTKGQRKLSWSRLAALGRTKPADVATTHQRLAEFGARC
jgi:hypothetical protein